MSFENSEKKPFSVAPLGGPGGFRWDDGVFTTVRQLVIAHSTGIDSLQIEYDKNGTSIWAEKHGGKGGNSTEKVKLAYPDEFLTSVHGYYGSLTETGSVFVRSLTFETNKKTYGPFGVEQGTRFSFPKTGGKIVGFHGRSSVYLNALGIHQIPEEQLKRAHLLANRFISTGTNNLGSTVIQASGGNNNDTVVGPAKQKTDHVGASQPKLSRPEEQLKIPSVAPVSANSPISNETINVSSLAIQGNNSQIVGSVKQKNDHIDTPQPKLSRQSPLDSSSPRIYDKWQSNHGGKESSSQISVGPWGGQTGARWDDGVYTAVKQVIVFHGAAIDSIQFEYDDKGSSIWSEKHGGTGGIKSNKVKLEFPEEYLVSISGHYGGMVEFGPPLVRSIVLESNRKKYGPFGIQQGTHFSVPVAGARVVGFHGRSSWYLDSIGVHLNQMNNWSTNIPPKPIGAVSHDYNGSGVGTRLKEVISSRHDQMDIVKSKQAGPWGGSGGAIFDDGVYTGVREVHLTRSKGVVSIWVCYDMNGNAVWGEKNGGTGGIRLDRIGFDYPSEVLTHITGHYGSTNPRGPTIVRSITFHTNRRKYGPFGDEEGTPFSSGFNNGKIIGFHGRKGNFVDSIGVHVMEGTTSSSRPLIQGSTYDKFFNMIKEVSLQQEHIPPSAIMDREPSYTQQQQQLPASYNDLEALVSGDLGGRKTFKVIVGKYIKSNKLTTYSA